MCLNLVHSLYHSDELIMVLRLCHFPLWFGNKPNYLLEKNCVARLFYPSFLSKAAAIKILHRTTRSCTASKEIKAKIEILQS